MTKLLLITQQLAGNYNIGSTLQQLEKATKRAGLEASSLGGAAGVAIQAFYLFGLLGSIFLFLMAYAGIMWMTAGGNEEQIAKAKKITKGAVAGFIIVLISYTITVGISEFLLDLGNK